MTLTSCIFRLPQLIIIVVFTSLLGACDGLGVRGSGDLVTETRTETGFNGLEINIPGNVEVRTDSVFSIEVTCEENIIQYLETDVDDGILKIDFDRNVYGVNGLKIRVSAPNWKTFDVNGSANVGVKDAINGIRLDVDVSGSGNIYFFDAVFEKSKISVSGSGNVELDGSGTDLDCTVSGSGDVDALDFPVKTAKVSVSGSGNVQVDVSDTLDASVSGSGDVEYQGNPEVHSNISGSGRVRKI
jgi:Putative auto-transporter adhesin, head GIN domain